jgi:acetyl-CoA C-acetyltransferase
VHVGIIGVGLTAFRPSTPESNWKELMFEAACRAYADAGVDPREDVGSFVTCAEDYYEGFGIFDEFVPDQLGAVLRPTCTVSGDGLQGLATAFMQIRTGAFDVAVVEAHSKISDVVSLDGILEHGLDPVWTKPLGPHAFVVAGLEADAYLRATRTSPKALDAVIRKNRANGLRNPIAAYGARLDERHLKAAAPRFAPLRSLDVSSPADGCVVLVVASEAAAKRLKADPVWIRGIGWASDSPTLETRDWDAATYARLAADRAYGMARLRRPAQDVDLAEVDDRFSFKELQHLEAIGLAKRGEAGRLATQGDFDVGGRLPVNASGGSLGCGNVFEATGLHRAAEIVLQLRGDAGRRQVDGAKLGVAQSWRFVPTATGAVAVLGVGA